MHQQIAATVISLLSMMIVWILIVILCSACMVAIQKLSSAFEEPILSCMQVYMRMASLLLHATSLLLILMQLLLHFLLFFANLSFVISVKTTDERCFGTVCDQ